MLRSATIKNVVIAAFIALVLAAFQTVEVWLWP